MFLADEGVDRSIVDGLRSSGFDVSYTIDEARALDDETILQIVMNEKRILIPLCEVSRLRILYVLPGLRPAVRSNYIRKA